MRILLDESIPVRLGRLLAGHDVMSVRERGWVGIKNGRLLALAATAFDVLLTADQNMAYQQNPCRLPVSILIVVARSNRLDDLAPLTGAILDALAGLMPRTLRRVPG